MKDIKENGITGSTLKLIAIAAMLIDHIAAVILNNFFIAYGISINTDVITMLQESPHRPYMGVIIAYQIMRAIGRLGFPIFCFLLIEGFKYTRSITRYAVNLGIFALISEIPFDLAFRKKIFFTGYQNVFFTLLLGLLAIYVISLIQKKESWNQGSGFIAGIGAFVSGALISHVAITHYYSIHRLIGINRYTFSSIELIKKLQIYLEFAGIALVIYLIMRRIIGKQLMIHYTFTVTVMMIFAFLADLLNTDYGEIGVITIVVMYLLRNFRVESTIAGCIVLTAMQLNELPAFMILFPVREYNGRRGLKFKYLFYLFYPLHLLILYLICVGMNLL